MFSGKKPLCLVIPTAASERTSSSVCEQAGGTLRYNFLAKILPLIADETTDSTHLFDDLLPGSCGTAALGCENYRGLSKM